jgi:hypothetical protein
MVFTFFALYVTSVKHPAIAFLTIVSTSSTLNSAASSWKSIVYDIIRVELSLYVRIHNLLISVDAAMREGGRVDKGVAAARDAREHEPLKSQRSSNVTHQFDLDLPDALHAHLGVALLIFLIKQQYYGV